MRRFWIRIFLLWDRFAWRMGFWMHPSERRIGEFLFRRTGL